LTPARSPAYNRLDELSRSDPEAGAAASYSAANEAMNIGCHAINEINRNSFQTSGTIIHTESIDDSVGESQLNSSLLFFFYAIHFFRFRQLIERPFQVALQFSATNHPSCGTMNLFRLPTNKLPLELAQETTNIGAKLLCIFQVSCLESS
jgi:hypothetical protein